MVDTIEVLKKMKDDWKLIIMFGITIFLILIGISSILFAQKSITLCEVEVEGNVSFNSDIDFNSPIFDNTNIVFQVNKVKTTFPCEIIKEGVEK